MEQFLLKEGNITILGQKTEFIGDMEFSDNLIITGKFNGQIKATGNLKIEKTAECKVSKIEVESLCVAGKVTGDIEAKSKLDIVTGGKITGDISTTRLRVDDNVELHGQVTMLDIPPDVDIFSVTAKEYKQACLANKEQ